MTAIATQIRRILLVDDDAFLRRTIRRMLREFGSPEVREASDGSEAIRELECEFNPGLIVCDIQMTPMDGMTFVSYLRGNPTLGCNKTPVLLLTATADAENVRLAKSLGYCGYLLKPVSQKALTERVNAIMSVPA